MPTEKPLVYLILGAGGSGRRTIVHDLATAGIGEGEQAAVLVSDDEPADPIDQSLPGLAGWAWMNDGIDADLPPGATHIFIVSDGRLNPVDQVEALKPWVEKMGAEVGRILTVVHCQLAEANPPLLAWYDACIHFSDVALLTHREGVDNKWMSDFQNRYKHQFIPCLFEFVKDNRVKSPAVVLDPVARRMAHLFDEELNWVVTGGDDEDEAEGDEEVEAAPEQDPYLVRHAGGRRMKEIPDIAKFLPEVE